MKTKTWILLFVSHAAVGVIGFAAGIYTLPILTAPPAPSALQLADLAQDAEFTAAFQKDLKGSDFLHQAEGTVTVGSDFITFMGSMSPGPDYKLYLSPEFVETEKDFVRSKDRMVQVGDIKTFNNFVVAVGDNINIAQYNTVIVWCESFGQFITAAQYR